MNLNEQKAAIRAFLRTEIWDDAKLCALLAHAQDKLSMWSCCCLVGTPTANHALRGKTIGLSEFGDHYALKDELPLAGMAEVAFFELGGSRRSPFDETFCLLNDAPHADELRRRRIRPIVRAEIRRRERERAAQLSREAVMA